MTQSLSQGSTLQSKWKGLGGSVGRMIAPPSRMKGFLFGLPGEGKSAFIQSHPNGYIFNLDASSTTTPNPSAVIFPGVDPENGRAVGDEGEHIVLTYDYIEAKVARLITLATANEPRPETIFFDSISAWISLLIQWIPPNAAKLGISREPATDWKQLHGPAAWDTLYSLITTTITKLHNAGYGVYVIGHVVNAKIPLEENRFIMKPELTITDGLWKRLYHMFELSALIHRERVDEVREIPQTVKRTDGRTETFMHKKTVSTLKVRLTVSKLELAGIAKARVPLPTNIDLPLDTGWQTFTDAYNTAASSLSDPLPS